MENTGNVRVSCETTREVVQVLFDPASLLKLAGSKICLHHLFQISGSMSGSKAGWVNILGERQVVQPIKRMPQHKYSTSGPKNI